MALAQASSLSLKHPGRSWGHSAVGCVRTNCSGQVFPAGGVRFRIWPLGSVHWDLLLVFSVGLGPVGVLGGAGRGQQVGEQMHKLEQQVTDFACLMLLQCTTQHLQDLLTQQIGRVSMAIRITRLYGPKSKYAGQVYIRWSSIDGKHKHICSPKQVITIDCQEKGIDPAPVIDNYNRLMQETHPMVGAKVCDPLGSGPLLLEVDRGVVRERPTARREGRSEAEVGGQ